MVSVATDAKAAALAEARHGTLAGLRCGVFLNLGTGTSAATVVEGRVLTGPTARPVRSATPWSRPSIPATAPTAPHWKNAYPAPGSPPGRAAC